MSEPAAIAIIMGSQSDWPTMRHAAQTLEALGVAYDDPALTFLLLHPGWVQTEMGGPDAEVPVEVSARGILERIALATSADSGTFRTWDGRPVAW